MSAPRRGVSLRPGICQAREQLCEESTLLICESVKGKVDAVALGSAEPARDRPTLIRQRNECAAGIIGIGFTLQQAQFDAL